VLGCQTLSGGRLLGLYPEGHGSLHFKAELRLKADFFSFMCISPSSLMQHVTSSSVRRITIFFFLCPFLRLPPAAAAACLWP